MSFDMIVQRSVIAATIAIQTEQIHSDIAAAAAAAATVRPDERHTDGTTPRNDVTERPPRWRRAPTEANRKRLEIDAARTEMGEN